MAEKRRKNGDGVLIKNPSGSFSIRKRYQIEHEFHCEI